MITTGTTHLIYFSPTGTTRRVVEEIASGIGAAKIDTHDLTLQTGRYDRELREGLAIVGIPVYAGRVPEICLKRMGGIVARGIPAVLVAVYGNREFEDALVELQDLAEANGFKVIAAAAFVGEHSFSTPGQPVAAGRPDDADLIKARAFGREIAGLLTNHMPLVRPKIPGNRPYRDRPPQAPIAPESNPETCTACGTCTTVCPTSAIAITGSAVATDADACLLCCACVKKCPEQARMLNHPMVAARRELLVANCSSRKEPAIYMVNG